MSADVLGVEQQITDALDALGADSDTVADRLNAAGFAVHHDACEAVCGYLQHHLDPAARTVVVEFCDTITVDFAVANDDGDTFTHASTTLPWPVKVLCWRADGVAA